MHGGVISTMAAVREIYWITKLRQLTKKVIRNCFGCKRFKVKLFTTPPQGQLHGKNAKNKREKKSYILLFTCSLTRAIHLELFPDQTKEEFIRALKRLIARRGCPETIYSDNAKTFVAAYITF